ASGEDGINRRDMIGAAAVVAAASELIAPARAQPAPRASASFGALKFVKAGVLNVAYAEIGPHRGAPVILLHGWPYDIYAFLAAPPITAARGHRVIVPSLRGYGATSFLSADTPRNGQQGVVAADVIALMDALHIKHAVIGGFDWGARTACIVAALW